MPGQPPKSHKTDVKGHKDHWLKSTIRFDPKTGTVFVNPARFDDQSERSKTIPPLIEEGGQAVSNIKILEGYYAHKKYFKNGNVSVSYDWENNTAEPMFTFTSLTQEIYGRTSYYMISSEKREVLFGYTGGLNTVIRRTNDGINALIVPGEAGAYGVWCNNVFQHINLNIAHRASWDGNEDRIVGSSNNSLFPGCLSISNTSSAGKQMFINNTRLWDIVPR